jgi:hypothetical protein
LLNQGYKIIGDKERLKLVDAERESVRTAFPGRRLYLIALQEANLSVGQGEIETGDAKFTMSHLRVLLKSTRKGVNQLHNEYIESASKTRRLGIIERRLGSMKGNYRTLEE